jgi:integrase
MAHDPRMKYLIRRGNTLHARLAIPRELRPLYGNATHKQEALGTGDLATADRVKHAHIAEWQREFARKQRQASGALAPDIQEAHAFREEIRAAANEPYHDPRDPYGEHHPAEMLRGFAQERAEEIEQNAGYPVAKRWYDLATKYERATLQESLRDWLDTGKHRTATKMQYRHAVKEMLAHLKLNGDALPEHVDRDMAKTYVRWLDTEAKGQRGLLAYGTKLGRLMALHSFWQYLGRNDAASVNPWEDLAHLLTGKKERHTHGDEMKHGHTEAQLLSLINGPDIPDNHRTLYPKRTLIELYALGSYTGCRLNELCSLTLADVEKTRQGYTIHIRKSKSPNGVRSLPVTHATPCAVLKRRIGKRKDPKEQLFEEFKLGGVGKLSANVQKALGRYRDRVGIPPEVDFHSTRRDLLTLLEAKGVNAIWLARYAGHKLPGVTFGVYAQVTPASLLEVANAVTYPKKVEDAFRKALDIQARPATR